MLSWSPGKGDRHLAQRINGVFSVELGIHHLLQVNAVEAAPDGGRDRVGRGERRLGHAGDDGLRDAGDEGAPFLDEGTDGGSDLRVMEADPEHVEGQEEQAAVALQLRLGQFESHPGEHHRVRVLGHGSAEADASRFPGSDQGLAPVLDGRHQEVFLGFEVVVRQPRRHAGFGRDVLHAGLVVAALDERAIGRVDDAFLRLIRHSANSAWPTLIG